MPSAHRPSRLPFDMRQTTVLIGLGAAFWLTAAVLLRMLGSAGIYDGTMRIAFYLLVVPGTLPLVLLTQRIAGLRNDQIALGVAVVTATATLLDGLALAWVPSLYGADAAQVAGAGAAILWGAGVGLVLGFALNRSAGS